MTAKGTIKAEAMKATLDANKLREALQKLIFPHPNKTLPSCAYIHMEFNNGKVTLTTTDMERAVKVELGCKVDESFSILIPRKSTELFLHGRNGSGIVTITKENNSVRMSRLQSSILPKIIH